MSTPPEQPGSEIGEPDPQLWPVHPAESPDPPAEPAPPVAPRRTPPVQRARSDEPPTPAVSQARSDGPPAPSDEPSTPAENDPFLESDPFRGSNPLLDNDLDNDPFWSTNPIQPSAPAPSAEPAQSDQPDQGQPDQDQPGLVLKPMRLDDLAPRIGKRGRLATGLTTGLATGGTLVAVLGCLAGVIFGGFGLFKWYGVDHLRDVVLLAAITALVVGGHAASSVWAWQAKPSRREVLLSQAPFPLTYIGYIVWLNQRFSPLFLLWLAAGLVAVAWLTIWYLRDYRRASRAAIYLAALAVLVAGSAGGGVLLGWRQTNGFGLVGEQTPWGAFDALDATSCLSGNNFHRSGSRTVQARCSGLDFGQYDTGAFGDLLCAGQPREVFQAWWDRSAKYQVAITLDFGLPSAWRNTVDGRPIGGELPDKISGQAATVKLTVQVQTAFRPGATVPTEEYPMRLDKGSEDWTVQLQSTTLGGWKVCRIDVADPITATANTGP